MDLEPWGGSIVPHERTLPGPIEDRLVLLRAVRANLSPVYVTIDGPAPELAGLLDATMHRPAARAVMDEDGTAHRLWVSTGVVKEASKILRGRPVMIADGHHRYAVALAYREEMRASSGPGPWDSMMMLIVDASSEQPPVLPFHRVLVDDPVPRELGQRVRDLTEMLALLDEHAMTIGVVTRENGDMTHRMRTLDGEPPVVCVLHEQVLAGVNPARLRFLPNAVAAEDMVRTGDARAAYLLPPTSVEEIRGAIVRHGRLPEKSTYFWPKPRTGLVMRALNE